LIGEVPSSSKRVSQGITSVGPVTRDIERAEGPLSYVLLENWNQAKEPLGWTTPSSKGAEVEYNLESVLRKRKKKMRRHKWKKYRKRDRFLRRKLGKISK
jgi:hypothetical protein